MTTPIFNELNPILRERFVVIFAVQTPSGQTVTVASRPFDLRREARLHGLDITLRPEYRDYSFNSIVRVLPKPGRHANRRIA